MTYIYPDRDTAEWHASNLSYLLEQPFALFDAVHKNVPVTCTCPLDEFGEPAELIAIYEVCS